MSNPPEFLSKSVDLAEVQGSHQPVTPGRRSELLAWVSTIGASLGTVFLYWRLGQVSGLALGGSLMFLALALIITFGNWVERNTELTVTEDAVSYSSPLRKSELEWHQIDLVRLSPSNRGWRVHVRGEREAFHFQTQGSIKFGGFDEMQVGLPDGESIAAFIKQQAGLKEAAKRREDWVYRRESVSQ